MVGEPATLSRLARLALELDVEREALDARREETAELLERWEAERGLPRAELVLVATNVHGYYTALETALERIARVVDDHVPAGPGWHAELLAQMRVEVPSLRPAVVAASILPELHELRRFRHFFRNAYVLELDPARVRAQAERLVEIHPSVRKGLADLREHLDDVIRELTR
ncbi:MAG: hypothetical protein KF729_31570 [Sandaracinaceae bacterium]|nr:hypothetical protein [Sandaracinaceae bacterium]